MSCPVCRQRKGRRACPALGETICTICCGTKRLVEIDCPSDCPHLATSREHPAAAVRRQQERDVAALMPTVRHLTERQHQLFFLFHTLISRHVPDGFARLLDADVAEAAAAIASTFETAARGVIYEHTPQALPAQKLAAEMKAMLEQMRQQGATVYDGEVAIALRAIADGARDAGSRLGGGDTAYLELMARLLQVNRALRGESADAGAGTPGDAPRSSIILP